MKQIYSIPFVGLTRPVTDRPLVEAVVDEGGGVVVRTRSMSVSVTKADLHHAIGLLEASDKSKAVAKLLEAYDRNAIVEMLEKACA